MSAGTGVDRLDTARPAWLRIAPLAGSAQTVNRGETTALYHAILAMRDAACTASLVFVTDSAYVVRGFAKVRAGGVPSSNGRLWWLLAGAAQGMDVSLIKIESHQSTEDSIRAGDEPFAHLINATADSAADAAAEQAQLPDGDVKSVQWGDAVMAGIRRHLAASLTAASDAAGPRPQPVKVVRKAPTWAARVYASEHHAVWVDRQYRCLRCSSSASESAARRWLDSPCHGAASPLPFVGRCRAHATHKCGLAGDFHYCCACGMVGKSALRKLAEPCTKKMTRYGKRCLAVLSRGLAPGDKPYHR